MRRRGPLPAGASARLEGRPAAGLLLVTVTPACVSIEPAAQPRPHLPEYRRRAFSPCALRSMRLQLAMTALLLGTIVSTAASTPAAPKQSSVPAPPVPVIPGFPGGNHYACQPPNSTHDFCDTSKTFDERTALLVANLSTEELVGAINKQGVPRLGVPPMGGIGAECLHGVWPSGTYMSKCPFPNRVGMSCTTVFPAASALSRSFNRSQWRAVGAAMGDEGRILFNVGKVQSLLFTGPQLDIQRDPRWGRNSNSPSECPFHTGAYGKAVTEGFQGAKVARSPVPHDPRYVKIANMMKHWTAYSVESDWWEGAPQGRMGFDANISIHDMVDTYFPGMRMAVEANISSAMCACAYPQQPNSSSRVGVVSITEL